MPRRTVGFTLQSKAFLSYAMASRRSFACILCSLFVDSIRVMALARQSLLLLRMPSANTTVFSFIEDDTGYEIPLLHTKEWTAENGPRLDKTLAFICIVAK